jgi:hypothetical protein
MRVVGFITQPAVITPILDPLRKREKVSRPPPHAPPPVASPLEIRPFLSTHAARKGSGVGWTRVPMTSRGVGALSSPPDSALAGHQAGRTPPRGLTSAAQLVSARPPREVPKKQGPIPKQTLALKEHTASGGDSHEVILIPYTTASTLSPATLRRESHHISGYDDDHSTVAIGPISPPREQYARRCWER